MSAIPTDHIYHRRLDPDGQDSLAKLGRLVRPGSRVLDLGAGPGVLGRHLTERLGCVVDGVEYNPAAVAEATVWYRRLECADLEQIELADCFADRYDFILCADILEHLRHPGALLAQLPGLLAQNGQLLLSVPNVAYAGLIAELLAGEFRYRPEGLLDATHLRFFTFKSLCRLLDGHGLRVIAVDTALRDWRESEFAERSPDALPPALTRALLGRPEALVYQFVVTAVSAAAPETALPILACPPPELRFTCQLFWRSSGEGYRESESAVAWGRLGEAYQKVILPIPGRSVAPEGLRLDVADRPGMMRLHAVTLTAKGGQRLWAWDGRRDSLARQPHWQLGFADLEPLTPGVTLWLAGDDPGLELPVPTAAFEKLTEGGALGVEFSWPMSLDYLALRQTCISRQEAEAARVELTQQAQALEASVARLRERNAELESAALARSEREAEREKALSALETELARQSAAWQARLREQTDELDRLRTLVERSWGERLRAKLRRWIHRT